MLLFPKDALWHSATRMSTESAAMTSMLPAWEDRLMGSVQVWARGFASYESRCEWFLLCTVLFLNP